MYVRMHPPVQPASTTYPLNGQYICTAASCMGRSPTVSIKLVPKVVLIMHVDCWLIRCMYNYIYNLINQTVDQSVYHNIMA